MSDVNTSTTTGTTVPKKNPALEAKKSNTNELLTMNNDGTAVYLKADKEENGKVIINTKEPIRNGINGNAIKGINQIILQNNFAKNEIKDREVITFDQGKDNGLMVKKGSKSIKLTIPSKKDPKTNQWSPNIITEFPTSSFFAIGEDGKAKNAKGDLALAKLNAQRLTKINKMRAQLHSEKTPEERKAKLLESIAFEHKKNLDYLSATKGSVSEYYASSIQPNESAMVKTLVDKTKEVPTLEQQKGRAVKELERDNAYEESKKATERPVINAENTTNPVDYIGKYLAASELGADFVTDKASQNQVQTVMGQNLQKAIETNNFDYIQTFGAECSERCKSVMSEFRKQSYEQQRGIQNEKTITQERPEQTVDAISF